MLTGGILSNIINKSLDLLLPQECQICQQLSKTIICDHCMSHGLRNIKKHRINNITTTHSVFNYDDVMKSFIHKLKFNKIRPIGNYLSNLLMRNAANIAIPKIDLWIPVPAHPLKVRSRGYNQVDLIFKDWAEQFDMGYWSPIVLRKRDTDASYELSKEDRESNVKDCFELVDPSAITGKNIMIMDDILTTGSTLAELAKTLQIGSPNSIHAITLAH